MTFLSQKPCGQVKQLLQGRIRLRGYALDITIDTAQVALQGAGHARGTAELFGMSIAMLTQQGFLPQAAVGLPENDCVFAGLPN